MPAVMGDPPEAIEIFFRPSKRRKIYRQREHDASPEAQDLAVASPPLHVPSASATTLQSVDALLDSTSASATARRDRTRAQQDDIGGTDGVSVAEILRLRKMRRPRGGMEFKSAYQDARRDNEEQRVVMEAESSIKAGDILSAVESRFAPQTGTVLDVNKHMTAYIDSEMAKRHAPAGFQPSRSAPSTNPRKISAASTATLVADLGQRNQVADPPRQPASQGKLQEIDLGEEVRSKNVELTERARRKLGGETIEDDVPGKKQNTKVRLGPDGKPWRGRKRRGSDDVKRDRLVEDVFLELYEPPPPSARRNSTGADSEGAADDRVAEAFRKEFMDAVQQRQQKKRAQTTATSTSSQQGASGSARKDDEVLRGPKLGGSRNARAAVREALLKAKK